MANWHKCFPESELALGKARSVEAGGVAVALCRIDSGVYAIEDICTHDGGRLDQGEVLDNRIECPRHGAMFDVRTGAVLSLPAVKSVRSFKTKVEGGDIYVEV